MDDFHPSITTVSTNPPYKTTTTYDSVYALGFAADVTGNLFVVGGAGAPSGGGQWVVRENPGGTGSWQTVDTFQYVSGKTATAYGIAPNNSGQVLVAGYGDDAANADHWLVRRSP